MTLHGPDGIDYKNEYVLLEVVEPERIVISHPDPEHNFQLIIILAEEGVGPEARSQRSEVRTKRATRTRLTWCQRFASRQHFEQVKPFVIEATEQNLDRLEAELAGMA